MALQVYNPGLATPRTTREAYSFKDERPVAEWRRKGHGRVTTVELSPVDLRSWSWAVGMDEALRLSWLAFFRSLGWVRDPFLLQDPRDPVRVTTLEPAVGDGAKTTFSLPTVDTHADYAFYPAADANALGLVSGADAALSAVGVDARTVTFAAPPGGGLSVGLTYQPLRLVRLRAPADVQSVVRVFAESALELEQLVRP